MNNGSLIKSSSLKGRKGIIYVASIMFKNIEEYESTLKLLYSHVIPVDITYDFHTDLFSLYCYCKDFDVVPDHMKFPTYRCVINTFDQYVEVYKDRDYDEAPMQRSTVSNTRR